MYKTAVRALVRTGISRLNVGDPSFIVRLASPGAELAFPGHNSWAAMFRPVEKLISLRIAMEFVDRQREIDTSTRLQFRSAGTAFEPRGGFRR